MSTNTAPESNSTVVDAATVGDTISATAAAPSGASSIQNAQKKRVDLMVDLETFSVSENSLILTAGIVLFDPYDKPGSIVSEWYEPLQLEQQTGGHLDINTILDFWFKQPEATEEVTRLRESNIPVRVEDLYFQFYSYWQKYGRDGILWANSPSFDLNIIRNLLKRKQLDVPWHFWQERDCRTLFKEVAPDVVFQTQDIPGGPHNALWDARQQAAKVQHIFAELYA